MGAAFPYDIIQWGKVFEKLEVRAFGILINEIAQRLDVSEASAEVIKNKVIYTYILLHS